LEPITLTYLGDSKTTSVLWTNKLVGGLRSIANWSSVTETPARLATSGWRVADLDAALDAYLASAVGTPNDVLINIGVNDANGGTSQASFEASLGSALDKVHTEWPNARIWLAKVWRGDSGAAEAQCDVINDTWMPNVTATRTWVRTGPDERIVIKASDNGATNSSDLVHYSTAGDTAWANAWQALIESTLLE
jgi:hypothetical protein